MSWPIPFKVLRGCSSCAPEQGSLKAWQVDNAYEHNISWHEAGEWPEDPPQVPAGHVVVTDAEMDLVLTCPRDKADVLVELLNWAAENYPVRYED